MSNLDHLKNKIHLADCMDIMAQMPDKYIDLCIVDPPYREKNDPDQWLRSHSGDMKKWEPKPNKNFFDELSRVSINQIIWGGNYFTDILKPNNNWIVWHKLNEGVHFSMCEMAYCTIKKNIQLYKRPPEKKKIHPTQKPVALYRWLLQNYAKPGDLIFDSHSGSGSCAIACIEEGFDFIACEIDEDYHRDSIERLSHYQSQGKLF